MFHFQQKKEISQVGEELKMRVDLILENWNEIKSNADRMGRDLKEAQDMLIIHDYFEKAETWIKEKVRYEHLTTCWNTSILIHWTCLIEILVNFRVKSM